MSFESRCFDFIHTYIFRSSFLDVLSSLFINIIIAIDVIEMYVYEHLYVYINSIYVQILHYKWIYIER